MQNIIPSLYIFNVTFLYLWHYRILGIISKTRANPQNLLLFSYLADQDYSKYVVHPRSAKSLFRNVIFCTKFTYSRIFTLVLFSFAGVISLSQNFKGVLLKGEDHNVTFNVTDKKFRAHQDILRARSEVFRSMLRHDMLEKNSGVINEPDCDPEAFEQLLHYIYTGKLERLDTNIMFSLYYAADKHNLEHLKEECCMFIKKSLSTTNVCDVLELASKHCDKNLLNFTTSYFFRNINIILTTLEWESFMKENTSIVNELLLKALKKVRIIMS